MCWYVVFHHYSNRRDIPLGRIPVEDLSSAGNPALVASTTPTFVDEPVINNFPAQPFLRGRPGWGARVPGTSIVRLRAPREERGIPDDLQVVGPRKTQVKRAFNTTGTWKISAFPLPLETVPLVVGGS